MVNGHGGGYCDDSSVAFNHAGWWFASWCILYVSIIETGTRGFMVFSSKSVTHKSSRSL